MAKTLSNPFRVRVIARPEVPPDDGAMPAWREGMQVFEWKRIPNTSLKYVYELGELKSSWFDRGYDVKDLYWGTHSSYSGGTADTRDSTLWMMVPGGHSITVANPVLRCKLSDGAPKWEIVRPPSCRSAAAPCGADEICTFVTETGRVRQCEWNHDGSPASTHTYYGNHFLESKNRLVNVFCGAPATGSPQYQTMSSYDPVAGQYEPAGTFPNCTLSVDADRPQCKDPRNDRLYVFTWSYNSWVIFNPETMTWEKQPSSPASIRFTKGPVAVDTRRNRIFQPSSDASSTKPPWILDLGTNTFSVVELGGLGKVFNNGSDQRTGWGMVFVEHPSDPLQDAFYLANDTSDVVGKVFRINAETFVVDELVTTGAPPLESTRNGSGNVVGSRLYSKWQYLPQYGVIAYWNDARQDVHVLRVR